MVVAGDVDIALLAGFFAGATTTFFVEVATDVVACEDVGAAVTTVAGASSSPALEPLAPLSEDASWAVMGDLASQMDFDEAGAAGLVVTPGGAEGALSQLSLDEQRAVVDLLQQEIKNSKSL